MENAAAGSTGVANGLEGVVVAETRLSHVDGAAGELILRGFPVERLALEQGYEAAAWLLWTGEVASGARRVELEHRLGGARVRAFEALDLRDRALTMRDGMDAL